MSNAQLESQYQDLPAAVRAKVEQHLTDAKVALKVWAGRTILEKENFAKHATTSAGRVGLKSGQVSELTVIAPLKPGGADRLRALFDLLGGSLAAVSNVGTLHDMRWVILDNDSKLLFATAYDGEWDPYIDDFATRIPEVMDYAFGNLEGWPGIKSPEVKDWIASYQIPAAGWYVAHPDMSVSDGQRLLELDVAVREFAEKLN
ncbi:hypothetical protein [Kocuria sp.]|uniref:hypothetical protein n=1 Tax=Kocuria sp. TaxID=1871328 RepID=UPI0026E0A9BA|nr:hypothetical protein [Kocuria sp.]MDO5619488.1 hypothetical protein [Kocuria sp.]